GLQHGPFSRLLYPRVHFGLRLADDLLDTARVDAPIHNQVRQRDSGDFAPNGVETRQYDRFRCIVNDEIYPGQRLEGADIAALPPDDAALHFVVRQRHDGDGRLRGLIYRAALNSVSDDAAGFALAFSPCFLLNVAHEFGRHMAAVIFDGFEKQGARFLDGE